MLTGTLMVFWLTPVGGIKVKVLSGVWPVKSKLHSVAKEKKGMRLAVQRMHEIKFVRGKAALKETL